MKRNDNRGKLRFISKRAFERNLKIISRRNVCKRPVVAAPCFVSTVDVRDYFVGRHRKIVASSRYDLLRTYVSITYGPHVMRVLFTGRAPNVFRLFAYAEHVATSH